MNSRSHFLDDKINNSQGICAMQVVFVDIVSYSKRLSYAQLGVIEQFMRFLDVALTSTAKRFVKELQQVGAHLRANTVILPLGDGALIAFPFESAPGMHLTFTTELLRLLDRDNKRTACQHFRQEGWCNCHSSFLLRCGISEGKVILYKDLNGNFNVASDVVNMAARVMTLADPSQVFLTEEGHKHIVELVPKMEQKFRKYSQVQIKHGFRLDVYQYIDTSVKGLDGTPRGGLEHPVDVAEPSSATNTSTIEVQDEVDTLPEKIVGQPKGIRIRAKLVDDLQRRMVVIDPGSLALYTPSAGSMTGILTQAFKIDPYAVTQQSYFSIMDRNPSHFVGETRPVECVSWTDAALFCNKLSELAGLEPLYSFDKGISLNIDAHGFRLPTEVEWEYCCRAGSASSNIENLEECAWFSSNSQNQTHDVGSKKPNIWGIFDMLGNTWEWCNDWYQRHYPDGTYTNFAGPTDGFERVLRGGSWLDLRECVKPAFRHRKDPLFRENTTGFRIVEQLPS